MWDLDEQEKNGCPVKKKTCWLSDKISSFRYEVSNLDMRIFFSGIPIVFDKSLQPAGRSFIDPGWDGWNLHKNVRDFE